MSPRRDRPEIVPFPEGYEPGYPGELTDEEFRTWIAASDHRRFLEIVLAGSLVWSSGCGAERAAKEQVAGAAEDPAGPASAAGPDRPGPRELRVLRHLSDLPESPTSWFAHATFPESTDPSIPLVPRVPISFGNSVMGWMDGARARQVALDLFRAYGLEVKVDAEIREKGAVARLDGWAPGARAGFLLRNSWDSGEAALTDAELAVLRSEGYRLHVAESEAYLGFDGDTFTSTIGYLAGVIDFLNSVTDGPDIELSALLRGPIREIPQTALEVRSESGELVALGPRGEWNSDRRSTLTLRRPEAGAGPVSEGDRGFSLLLIRASRYAAGNLPPELERSPWEVRVRQPETGTVVESRSLHVFPPATFDPHRPFEIDLTLGPGNFALDGLHVRTRN